MRIVRALEGSPGSKNDSISATVCQALLTDPAMQSLLPHLSLFIYSKVRDSSRTLPMMHRLMRYCFHICIYVCLNYFFLIFIFIFIYFHRALWCLVLNSSVCLDFHLQQLLPAIFTCIVANSLCPTAGSNRDSQFTLAEDSDPWSLRSLAAEVIGCCCLKYSTTFPDLQVIDMKYILVSWSILIYIFSIYFYRLGL